MSPRKKKKAKAGRRPVPVAAKKRFPFLRVSLVVGIAVVATMVILSNIGPNQKNSSPQSTGSVPKTGSTASSRRTDGYANLIGRWLRPDGGYIIEIRGIGADGRMEAAYLNPRPINVSRAEASWKKSKQEVFIELQDAGYPGSTYTLDYKPDQDVLTGIYFQAAMKQTFEVVFVRTK
jgi:hypothetical protein